MSERITKIALAGVVLLLGAYALMSRDARVQAQQTIGTFGRVPAHGQCVGIVVSDGIVCRAFADGTVEAYRIGSGQTDWRPITALSAVPSRK